FFFSSRRRHTRSKRDWSSDVCSSDLGDLAVFYRTNAQSRVLEEVFVRSGIPYRVVGGVKFYDRREVKDLLAYLRALANPDDEVRSEERRVGKECRAGWGQNRWKEEGK